jgi:hypothetical protein
MRIKKRREEERRRDGYNFLADITKAFKGRLNEERAASRSRDGAQ